MHKHKNKNKHYTYNSYITRKSYKIYKLYLRSRMVTASCGTNGSNLGETYFLKLVKKQAMEI